jgi:hypothetical protein
MKCEFFSGMYEIFRSVIRTYPGSYSPNIIPYEINLSDTIFINFLEFRYIPWPTIHVSIAHNTGPNTLSPRSWQLPRTCRFLACLQITGVAL